MDTKQLENKIVELEKQINSLKNASSIPYTIDNAFGGRGFIKTGEMGQPSEDWYTNIGFIVDPASVSEVQAPATQYLRIQSPNGKNWFIALYNFSELT
jgi:uncharacterized protein YciU (UPF0263 family)